MLKKFGAILLALVLIVSLAACSPSVTTPTRGVWEDRVFTSESFGLRFVLPSAWEPTTDLQLSIFMGFAEPIMVDAGLEIPEDVDILHDMMAINPLTGANVQLIFQRGGRGRPPSGDELIEFMREALEDTGLRVTGQTGNTRIGDNDWYYFGTEIDMMGTTIPGRQFFSIYAGYIRLIIVTYMPGLESLEEIMPMFIGLDDPLPELPEIQHAEELLGTWHWDANDDYTYLFNADGTGRRGFTGAIESFEWRTDGDTLIIVGTMLVEGWSFSVAGNVFTIDSLQTPGLSFSYIRAGADGQGPLTLDGEALSQDLIGLWHWDATDEYSYVFNADGTGTRGFIGDIYSFEWSVDGDTLTIVSPIMTELWSFSIVGDVLTIDSLQAPGLSYSYVRDGGQNPLMLAGGELNQELVGIWDWDEDAEYSYNFSADGTGTRGWPEQIESFEWQTDGDHLVIRTALMAESWTFTIADGVFTIESRQMPGLTFSYIARQMQAA